ncbi:MAG: hypothetical protein QNJ94_00520 [Alphaproteobacteria bacterium]|nr:hypothetical protein [Alphaproteobacteria bacterium]
MTPRIGALLLIGGSALAGAVQADGVAPGDGGGDAAARALTKSWKTPPPALGGQPGRVTEERVGQQQDLPDRATLQIDPARQTQLRKLDLFGTQLAAKPAGDQQAPAEEGGAVGLSVEEAARQSSNPLGGNFWILLNQFDNYFLEGDISSRTRHLNTWAFQPVIPIPLTETLGENWIWVNRPTFPTIMNASIPDVGQVQSTLIGGATPEIGGFPPPGGAPFTSKSGFGDIVYFSLVGQSLPQERWGGGDLVWAGGLTQQFPTASDTRLGTDQYSLGPSGVLAFIGRKFIVGALLQQWFSVASTRSDASDVNFTWLNLFYFLNFDDGWQIGGTPIITADWEADSGDRWTVPLGFGVYKTHFFGRMPIKFGIEGQWMPQRPDVLGQEWNIRVVVAPIIPALF